MIRANVGDESLAALLRLLTVSELFDYSEFYANHPQIKDSAAASVWLFNTSLFNHFPQ